MQSLGHNVKWTTYKTSVLQLNTCPERSNYCDWVHLCFSHSDLSHASLHSNREGGFSQSSQWAASSETTPSTPRYKLRGTLVTVMAIQDGCSTHQRWIQVVHHTVYLSLSHSYPTMLCEKVVYSWWAPYITVHCPKVVSQVILLMSSARMFSLEEWMSDATTLRTVSLWSRLHFFLLVSKNDIGKH